MRWNRILGTSLDLRTCFGRAEFRGRDHDYETHTEIAVSPEDDIELRRVRITNFTI